MTDCRKVTLHRQRLAELRTRYLFDEAAADKAVRIIERYLVHWKAPHSGKPFLLSPWQRDDIVRPLFGLKHLVCACGRQHAGAVHDGDPIVCDSCGAELSIGNAVRVFREAYIQIGRKNGKTALAAAILLVIMLLDGEGLELYCAATKKEQARIVYDDCCKFIRQSPELKERLRIFKGRVEYTRRSCILKPLSSDQNSLDGLNVAGAVIDELHQHPTPHVHDVILTATGSREQPLVLNITTAGQGEQGVCHDMYDYAEKILEGVLREDSFFAFIAEADKEIAWDDPRAIPMANPNLGISIKPDYLLRELQKAKDRPSYRKTYQRYHLNRWVEQSGDKWLSVEKWKAAQREFTAKEMIGAKCFGGLDLSTVTDISAFARVYPWGDGVRILLTYWMPETTLYDRARQDRVPFDLWAEQGWIRTTPGEVIDYDQIKDDLCEMRDASPIERIAYDDWNATQITQQLEKKGFDLVNFIQGTRSFHTPAMELERLLMAGKLYHDGNPVTTWMASNCRIKRDVSGKIRPVRESKHNVRIDGVIATIMGLDCNLRQDGEGFDMGAFAGLRGRLGM